MRRSSSCPTPKSSKSPQSSPDRAEDKEYFTSAVSLEKALCALKLKGEEILALREELTEREKRNQELDLQLQEEDLLYNDLNSKFSKISQQNDANVERIMWLETENERLIVDVEELQKQLREIQNDPSENIKALTEKIATQECIIEFMDWSKRKLEKEIARLMAVNKTYLESEDKDKSLQSQVKSLELSRIELEKEARLAHRLSQGNWELENQVAQAVERVVVAERRISQLLGETEALEQQNLTLREDKEDLLMSLQSSQSGKTATKSTFESRVGKLTVETSNSEGDVSMDQVSLTPLGTSSTVSPVCLANMFDQSRSTSDDRLKGLLGLDSIREAPTPSQYGWKDTPRENRMSLPNEYLWKESPKSTVSGYIRKVDVLEEYLYLSASAVKINFPTVRITNDELLHEARKMPYHKVYDFLRARMELKLREQETQNKRDSEKQRKSKFRRIFSWSSPAKKRRDSFSPPKKRKDSLIKTISSIL